MRVEFMPAFLSGISLNILFRMYSMYWGTSRKLRSVASDAITPVSSSWSPSSHGSGFVFCDDFLRGLADEAERRRPNAAATLGFLGLVMREERADVVWNDMLHQDAGVRSCPEHVRGSEVISSGNGEAMVRCDLNRGNNELV